MPGEILDNQGRGEASWSWPSVHPEGRKFGAIAAALALVGWIVFGPLVGLPLVLLTYCVLAFFRDPVRVTPQDDRYIVAPADGLVTLIGKVSPPRSARALPASALRSAATISGRSRRSFWRVCSTVSTAAPRVC